MELSLIFHAYYSLFKEVMIMSNEQVISEFRKNTREEIRVSLSNYQGHDLIDIRVYYHSGNIDGDMFPTKKGITMSTKLIPDLKKAVDRALDECQEESIII
jgi:hypothetical protein